MKMTFKGGPLNGRAASVNTDPRQRVIMLEEKKRPFFVAPGGFYVATKDTTGPNPTLVKMEFTETKPAGHELNPAAIVRNLKPLPRVPK